MWRVLLADDEPFVREGLMKLIEWEELGYELKGTYKNGRELIDAMPEKLPDLVILDIQMPIMDGLEAARVVQDQWPEVFVVILTAYAEFQYAQDAIAAGVCSYVLKSSLLDELPKTLQRMTDRLAQRREEREKLQEFMQSVCAESDSRPDPVWSGAGKEIDSVRPESGKDAYCDPGRTLTDRPDEADRLSVNGWSEENGQEKKGNRSENEIVRLTEQYVEEHLDQKLTLDEIAAAVFVNRSYLSYLYKAITGENLFEMINRRRVELAKAYIRKGDRKIYEIGQCVGLDDPAYFSKIFKKLTGISPKEYARNQCSVSFKEAGSSMTERDEDRL